MYRVLLLIAIGVVLALVGVFRLPHWPTAQSTGSAASCVDLAQPVTRAQARRELERRRAEVAQGTDAARLAERSGGVAEQRRAGAVYGATRANERADAPCIAELEHIASGDRLSEARGEWMRVTALILILSIGALVALYFGRIAALRGRWRRR
ncbi:hypothetical protein [Lysobacter auxotrophicus]|uniref:Uncharacterized protein n=1 Tax=Lysobacter auxotrophicus TaxID=2992573 RepID=A0ABN6UK82_9GAMM|nr:hypothetical protein [Lysobacter auxotrophicus]BDU16728.1 hypothetical protein LA521A_19290 [Lysobacter auxotrophicus]